MNEDYHCSGVHLCITCLLMHRRTIISTHTPGDDDACAQAAVNEPYSCAECSFEWGGLLR